jgi:GAF domain-containing protein
VVVADIENDPLWADYRALALPLGLLACWSSPIKLRDGRVAGTFAFYYHSKREPSVWHHHIVEACVHLCVVAIERALAKAHIARLAYYDALTGLPNRTMLRERIGAALADKVDGRCRSLQGRQRYPRPFGRRQAAGRDRAAAAHAGGAGRSRRPAQRR